MTSQDMIFLVYAANDVIGVIANRTDVLTTPPTDTKSSLPPRVSVLAPLCLLHVNFTLDTVELALLSDKFDEALPLVAETLKGFADILSKRGSKSNAVLYSKELALKRLQKLTLPLSEARSSLSFITRCISKGHSIQDSVDRSMVHLRPLLTPHNTDTEPCKNPIFEISLKGLKLHHYRLTYDHRSELQIKDFLLSDHARFPVFHIEFQKDYDKEKEKMKMKMKMKMTRETKMKQCEDVDEVDKETNFPSSTKPLCAADIEERARVSEEEEAEKNACALTVSYVQQVRYTTLHFNTAQCTTLHYTTQHYTTQHYTTLHYTTVPYLQCVFHALTFLSL